MRWISSATFALPAAFAILACGCTDRTSQQSENSTSEISGGVVDMTVLTESDLIERVIDIEPIDENAILVLNSNEPFLLRITGDGVIAESSGRRGWGPGEFRRPMALLRGPDGNGIWVYDAGRRSLFPVHGADSAAREIRLPTDALPPSRLVTTEAHGTLLGRPWMNGTDGGFIIARSRQPFSAGPAMQPWHTELVLLRGEDSVSTVLAIADLIDKPATRFGNAESYLPYPLWAQCADRSYVVYDPLSNSLRRFSRDAQETESLPLPPERNVAITQERFWKMTLPALIRERRDTAAFRHVFNESWAEASAQMSPAFPEYVDAQCAGDVVWLQQHDYNHMMGHGPTWVAVKSDGTHRIVKFADGFRPLLFTDTRAWGVRADELDVESIAWSKIE